MIIPQVSTRHSAQGWSGTEASFRVALSCPAKESFILARVRVENGLAVIRRGNMVAISPGPAPTLCMAVRLRVMWVILTFTPLCQYCKLVVKIHVIH